jgi:methionyl aminopeptidase
MGIKYKSEREIKLLREAGRLVGQTHQGIAKMIQPGLNILEIERFVSEEFARHGAIETFRDYTPAPKYPPYPSNVCISINEELVHGIPRDRVLKEGDIISIDLGATLNGYVGDAAFSYGVGEVSDEVKKLMKVTEDSLWAGIRAAAKAKYLNDICAAIEDAITPSGYSIVRGYGGHGVGRSMHEDPHVPNHRMPNHGPRVRPGMVIALEPMVNIGAPDVEECDDKWTVRTKDGSLCCHFEHTIAVREGGEVEVLTLP